MHSLRGELNWRHLSECALGAPNFPRANAITQGCTGYLRRFTLWSKYSTPVQNDSNNHLFASAIRSTNQERACPGSEFTKDQWYHSLLIVWNKYPSKFYDLTFSQLQSIKSKESAFEKQLTTLISPLIFVIIVQHSQLSSHNPILVQ